MAGAGAAPGGLRDPGRHGRSTAAAKLVSTIAVGSVSLSAVVAILLTVEYTLAAPAGGLAYSQTLWQWMRVGHFAPSVTLRLDALSVTMMVVVAFVSALIHVYSTGFMADDEGYSRFFAYMNLFVGSMLILVLADNLLLLVPGLGGRRAVQLSADRLLVPGAGQRPGRAEGVLRDPDRRYGVRHRHLPAVHVAGHSEHPDDSQRHFPVPRRIGSAHRSGGFAAGGGHRQVRPASSADVASRRHGRSDAGQRPDPRRHDGDRRRLSHRPDAHALSRWRPPFCWRWRSSGP